MPLPGRRPDALHAPRQNPLNIVEKAIHTLPRPAGNTAAGMYVHLSPDSNVAVPHERGRWHVTRLQKEYPQIGFLGAEARPLDTYTFDRVLSLAQTRGIEKGDRNSP